MALNGVFCADVLCRLDVAHGPVFVHQCCSSKLLFLRYLQLTVCGLLWYRAARWWQSALS